ncbi:hypothetical protein [Raoultella terrigena]|uniref:hypothetical protein n=1 Tax=Raoultella terrigena TaxID=577 RepID=UPI0038925B7B
MTPGRVHRAVRLTLSFSPRAHDPLAQLIASIVLNGWRIAYIFNANFGAGLIIAPGLSDGRWWCYTPLP